MLSKKAKEKIVLDILNEMYLKSKGPFKVSFDDLIKYTPYDGTDWYNPSHRSIPYDCFYLSKAEQDDIIYKHTKHLNGVWMHWLGEMNCNLDNYRAYQKLLKEHNKISQSTYTRRINKYAVSNGFEKLSPDINGIKLTVQNYAPSYSGPYVDKVIDAFNTIKDNNKNQETTQETILISRCQHLHNLKYNIEHNIRTDTYSDPTF